MPLFVSSVQLNIMNIELLLQVLSKIFLNQMTLLPRQIKEILTCALNSYGHDSLLCCIKWLTTSAIPQLEWWDEWDLFKMLTFSGDKFSWQSHRRHYPTALTEQLANSCRYGPKCHMAISSLRFNHSLRSIYSIFKKHVTTRDG